MPRDYREWCEVRGVTHAHCVLHCDKPQPTLLPDGRLVCGRCLVVDGVASECVACTPDVCGD